MTKMLFVDIKRLDVIYMVFYFFNPIIRMDITLPGLDINQHQLPTKMSRTNPLRSTTQLPTDQLQLSNRPRNIRSLPIQVHFLARLKCMTTRWRYMTIKWKCMTARCMTIKWKCMTARCMTIKWKCMTHISTTSKSSITTKLPQGKSYNLVIT